MKILKLTEKNCEDVLESALKVLKHSGLIIFPTDTCYGAGVLATDSNAVLKLLKYKKRPSGKPISIAVSDKSIADKYAEINDQAKSIYQKFLPGAVTIVSKYIGGLADGLASEYGTIGVRIPDNFFVLELLQKLGEPISATSANTAGKKTPYTMDDILSNISKKQVALIDLAIDAGELPKNPPSTVIDTTKESMQVLRQGHISPDDEVESFTIFSEEEMRDLGIQIIKNNMKEFVERGLIILFNAELGAGKTQLVKGFARALGIKEIVKSPTYSLIEEYNMEKGKLIHIDAWRLENLAELKQLNIEQYAYPGNIIAVEWSGGAEHSLINLAKRVGMKLISIEIEYIDKNTRKVKLIQS